MPFPKIEHHPTMTVIVVFTSSDFHRQTPLMVQHFSFASYANSVTILEKPGHSANWTFPCER